MRWRTHLAGGLLGALLCHLSPAGIAAALSGSIFPDVIDQKVSSLGITRKGKQRIFNKIHRGASHWFGWWLLLFLLAAAIGGLPCREVFIGLGLGGLSHILLDMLTTRGVPVYPFSRKTNISLRYCSTGSLREYAFLVLLILLIGGALYFSREDQITLRQFISLVKKFLGRF